MKLKFKQHIHRYSWFIERGYGVYAIRNKREAKALYRFCLDSIADAHEAGDKNLDTTRNQVYENTIEIYRNNFCDQNLYEQELIFCDCGHCDGVFLPYDIWAYTNNHAGWYWR